MGEINEGKHCIEVQF